MTNPDNVGGLPPLPRPSLPADNGSAIQRTHGYTADQMRAYGELCRAAPAGGDEGLWQPTPCPTCNGFCGDSGPTCAEVRDAAPACDEYRGTIPQALDETINGIVSDLEMIASGKDQVTGDPVSALQSQRIAKSAHDRLLSAWNACESAPAGGEPVVVRDIEAERKLASRGTPGIDRLWDTQWVNIVNHDACYFGYTVEEAVNTAVKLTEQKMAENFKAAAQDSGPAGSGEVEEDIEALSQSLELMAQHRDEAGWNCDAECLRTAAALIRKLQQGAG